MLFLNLDWKIQLYNVCIRINKFVYALRQVKNVTLYKKTAIMSYRAHVESILRYGILLWRNSTNSYRVFIAQKQCIRAK